jgi:glyoxylase-like metal-dependent hydrolase (beta-lactamase superfamily II)
MKYYQELGFDITCIDTRHMRDDFVACYLIKSGDDFAFVDSGVQLSAPHLLQVLKNKGIANSQVKYIFVTHAHLDHAGGAGELLKHLPNAKVVAQKSCAKHLINPENLKNGVIKVYGELFFKQYLGDIIPVPEEKIIIANNQTIDFNGRSLQLITTFGHAYHHYVVFDKLSNGVFSGDTLGVSYKELNDDGILIFPPTTPTGFDPENWLKSIDLITNLGTNKAYLTHYCQIDWDIEIASQLKQRIVDFCDIATKYKDSASRVKDIQQGLFEYLQTQTNAPEKIKKTVLKADIVLCAKGLDYWLSLDNS